MNVILFSLVFVIYLLWFDPKIGNHARSVFFSTYQEPNARVKLYQNTIQRNLILGLWVLALIYFFASGQKLGLTPIDWTLFAHYSQTAQILITICFFSFFFYFFYFVTIGVRLNPHLKPYLIEKIRPVAITAPQEKQEFLWWTVSSFSCIFEELAYRGFIFYFIFYLFPNTSLWIASFAAIFIEAVRYAPRLAAVRYVAIRASIFTLTFVVFHSLYAAIVLHIAYNLRIMAVPFHWALEQQEL
jgi:hypothetical protein